MEKALVELERAIENVRRAMRNAPSALAVPERSVAEWLRKQQGEVTSRMVAEQVFEATKENMRSTSMQASHSIRAAGWEFSRKSQGTRYWKRGKFAEPYSDVRMPAPR